ncbi:MAG: sensor histidine kinase, partial [Bryobacteraceae bacterium]
MAQDSPASDTMIAGGRLRAYASFLFSKRTPVVCYGMATGFLFAAFLICLLFQELLDRNYDAPFIAAVALTAWFCGLGPSLAAIAISTLLQAYFFLPPYWQAGLQDTWAVVSLLMFIGTSGLIVALVQNISRTRTDLAHSQERYRNLAELIPFGGWVSNPHGSMLHVSESFLNAFQTNMSQCKGLGWIELIVPEQREQVLADWKECMRSGYFWDCEYRMVSRSGTFFTVLSRGVPIYGAGGRVGSWVGIHLDVTEREKSKKQTLQQERDLERFNAELEQFAYVSSHDLQEPLRMIASYVQLLGKRYRGKLDADADTFIDYAVDGANRLQGLLQDLLLLSQIGKVPENRKVHQLGGIIERAAERCKTESGRPEARITFDDMPALLFDEMEMTQVFSNLFDNAIKYSDEGVLPRIHVSAELQDTHWKIGVQDNGIGIDPEFAERIFGIFQRLHRRAEYPGT